MIKFDNVSKVFHGDNTAVDELSLEVPAGKLTVFVGSSGSGKTTALRMINRMIEPTSGTITVDGADVSTVNPVKLRLGIGYVIQNAGLLPHQRVIDNVATVPVLQGQPRRAARRPPTRCSNVSGWIPQSLPAIPRSFRRRTTRVGVARALAADPPILLMDEPFSAVDPVVRHELQNEILRLQSELRKTIVFVTHDIDEALKLADQVAVFGRGGVLQQYDEPARLLSRPATISWRNYRSWAVAIAGCNSSTGPGCRCTTWSGSLRAASLSCRSAGLDAGGRRRRRAVGWIDADGLRSHRGGASLSDVLSAVGAQFGPGGNLSQALDAALSSPLSMGIAVDHEGKVVGGILATDVLAVVEAGGGPERDRACTISSSTTTTPGR